MDEQCSCIWRTVNSSVKHTTRRSFVSLSLSLSLTHTHTHVYLAIQMGTSHRRNGFYTVQTVCAIALHLPYT